MMIPKFIREWNADKCVCNDCLKLVKMLYLNFGEYAHIQDTSNNSVICTIVFKAKYRALCKYDRGAASWIFLLSDW